MAYTKKVNLKKIFPSDFMRHRKIVYIFDGSAFFVGTQMINHKQKQK